MQPSEGEDRWAVEDLKSKNGTFLCGNKIERHLLGDGDELRIGRTRVTFKAGAMCRRRKRGGAVERPVDPSEALAGTVTGMVVCEPGESQTPHGMPSPKPRPADSAAYKSDDVYGMISDIISNSWDSVMAQNSQPVRMQRAIPAAAVTRAGHTAGRPPARVSFALQAAHREEPAVETPSATIKPRRPLSRRRRWVYASATIAATVAFIIALAIVTMNGQPHEASGANASSPSLPQAQSRLQLEPPSQSQPASFQVDPAPPREAPESTIELNLAAV